MAQYEAASSRHDVRYFAVFGRRECNASSATGILVHGRWQADLHHALHTLQKHTAHEIAHDYDCLEERARLLAAGAVILLGVLSRYGLDEASVKPNGIRGGLVVSYARYGGGWRQEIPRPLAAQQ